MLDMFDCFLITIWILLFLFVAGACGVGVFYIMSNNNPTGAAAAIVMAGIFAYIMNYAIKKIKE